MSPHRRNRITVTRNDCQKPQHQSSQSTIMIRRKRRYSPSATLREGLLKLALFLIFTCAASLMVLNLACGDGNGGLSRGASFDNGQRRLSWRRARAKTKHASHRKNNLPQTIVSPLRSIDYEKYTVRVNTWKRPQQLKLVLYHLLTCPNVERVQVVWCTAQGALPDWLEQMPSPRIQVEEHSDNSLNARFDILMDTPTAGILTQDDDVMRPCEAMDAGFALWTLNPDRMVGFDARSHGIKVVKNKKGGDEEEWSYVPLSGTQRSNQYSLVLTRFSFVHRDFLHSYTHQMPAAIRERVAKHLNCEDIAMSLWVSAQTQGALPLLVDAWAFHTQMKLSSDSAISTTSGHKNLRNKCVNDFADWLHLKDGSFSTGEWVHHHDHKNRESLPMQWGAIGAKPEDAAVQTPLLSAMLQHREHFGLISQEETFLEIRRMKMEAEKNTLYLILRYTLPADYSNEEMRTKIDKQLAKKYMIENTIDSV